MCKHLPAPLPTLAEAAPAAAAVAVQKANDDAAQTVEAALQGRVRQKLDVFI